MIICFYHAMFSPTKQGFDEGEGMGYKKWRKEIGFADLAVSKSLEHNRSLKMMNSIEKVVKWRDVEALLPQKWFRIPSDPELENQINDRISFKKFLSLPLDKPSPDHSTFSRFRNRLSE